MTQKLTKNILVKLIKEEIIKVHLTEQTMGKITKAEIDRRISNAQGQIRFYQRDLRQMRKQGLGVPGGEKLFFRMDRAKGLDYPTGTNTLGKASRFANKMIKKFNKEISDLKGLPQYAAALSVAGQPGIATAPPPPGSALSPTPMPKLSPIPVPGAKPTKKRRRRSRGPYFFRKYRKAGIDKAFAKEFGGTDRAAFDKFYDRVNMPARSRDYQFGPGHYRKFTGIMGKDRASMPGTKASKSPMKTMGDFNQNLEQVVRKYMGPYKASITTGDMKRTAAKAVADLKRRTNNDPKVPSVADMEMVLRQAR